MLPSRPPKIKHRFPLSSTLMIKREVHIPLTVQIFTYNFTKVMHHHRNIWFWTLLCFISLCLTKGYLRGFHRSRFNDHLDLVLGAGQQLDGPGLAEPGAVGFKIYRAVVGEHPQGNPNFDDLRHVGHASEMRAQSIIEQVSPNGRGRGNAVSMCSQHDLCRL